MKRRALSWTIAGIFGLLPQAAIAKCQLSQLLQLPVTMGGARPIVSARIGAKDARFILDSGAFYSTLSNAAALEYDLRLEPMPSWFKLHGINGQASVSIAKVKDFGLAGITIPSIEFLVGGSDTGLVGVLGQNVLGIADVEYDLPHGQIRLMRPDQCDPSDLAYWAGQRPVTIVSLKHRAPPFQTHTIGTVVLNGVKLRAIFDTGPSASLLTLAAAKRAGVTPKSAGIQPGGNSSGFGQKSVPTWLATFESLDIGGEMIPHPKIRIGDVALGEGDMLIGVDFFLTHRVYVANKAARMFVTYEGGPMFGLNPKSARASDGRQLDLTDAGPEPTDAEGFSRRGAVNASTGKLDRALADFDRAVTLSPNDPRYLRQRAMARMANHQPLLASADLDQAIKLDPADPETRMMRAAMRLRANDEAGATDDLRAADKTLPPSSDRRLPLAGMFDDVGDFEAALSNAQAWLKSHPEDASRPSALNSRCWARALLNRELSDALADCDAALRLRPGNSAFLDSRALVRVRRGEWRPALADYDAALKAMPRNAWSLYGRSIVKRKLGDGSGADADRAAALAINAKVAERGRKIGLEN